ncbi:hypothetical protein [Reyranella sp.]|uniref:hypothetical protein n=1 Tax=Reyranella sp. TaxID=1929291 RepID=UPI003C7C877A
MPVRHALLIAVIVLGASPAGAEWRTVTTNAKPPSYTLFQESQPPGLNFGFSCAEGKPREVSLSTWSWDLDDNKPLAVQITTQRGTKTWTFAPTKDAISSWRPSPADEAAIAIWLEEGSDKGVGIRVPNKKGKLLSASFPGELGFSLYSLRGSCGG